MTPASGLASLLHAVSTSRLPLVHSTSSKSLQCTSSCRRSPVVARRGISFSSEVKKGAGVIRTPSQSSESRQNNEKPSQPITDILKGVLSKPKLPLPSFTSKTLTDLPLPGTKKAASSPFVMFSGRTRPVVNGDISAAFRSLNQTLKVNNVAKDYRTQKFHEKPSNKRVRLARERHRRRFLSGVKRLVNLVKEQRKFS